MAIHPQLLSNHIILIWHLPLTPGLGELEVHVVALKDIPATQIPTQDVAIICHSTQHILRGHIPSGCLTKDMELHLRWIDTGIIHNPSKVSSIIKLLVSMFLPVYLKDNSLRCCTVAPLNYPRPAGQFLGCCTSSHSFIVRGKHSVSQMSGQFPGCCTSSHS